MYLQYTVLTLQKADDTNHLETKNSIGSRYKAQKGFPGGLVVKNLPVNAGDTGLIPSSGRCPGEGNGNPLQYSCLENPLERRAWQPAIHRVTKS